MTKKIFAMFLAVLMVVSMLPTSVFAANECPGKNDPKHSTSNCDYTVVKVTDPTCGTDGHTSYKCNKCGYTFAEKTADATGEHSFVAGEGKAPTCVTPGYEAGLECEVCGLVKPGKEIPALDKDAESCEWELVSGYDCDDKNGKLVFKCAFCGATKEEKRTDDAHDHAIYWGQYVAISATEAAFFCYYGIPGVEGYTGCSHYVVADIKNAHDCAEYLFDVAEVPATCTTDGMKAYEQCRVCNTKYTYIDGELTALTAKVIEDEEFIIKAGHTFAVEPTCADTLMQCTVCNKYVNPGVEHDIDWKNIPDTDKQDPTCLKPGYMYDTCANCKVKELKILEALGHNEITVTMPSTCGTYAYTFTYCTHENCDAPVLSDLASDYAVATGLTTVVYDDNGMSYSVKVAKPAVTTNLSKGFILGMNQENLGKELFFNGTTKEGYSYYMATTADAAEAVTMYVEKLENFRDRYLMYFVDAAGVKTYIQIYKASNGYKNIGLTTETPSTYWQWDATLNTLVTVVDDDVYFMGVQNNKNYDTFQALKYNPNYDNFEMMPYTMSAKTGVQLTGFTFDVKGGYNAEEHVYDVELGSIVLPTCTKAGSYDMVCVYCFDTVTVEIPAGCANNLIYAAKFGMNTTCAPATAADLTAAGIKNTAPAADATCTEGAYQYYKCSECEDVFKVTLSAPLGHHMSIFHDDTAALSHTKLSGYIGYDCAYCDYAIKLETISWKNANKLYDSVEDAAKDHTLSATYTLSKYGNCTVTGILLYTCTECNKNVRVRRWEEIDGKLYPTGEHAGERLYHQDPTCTAEGYHITYQCARCDAIIGNKALGETETLKKLPHSYVEVNTLGAAALKALGLKEYKAAPCDEPNYTNTKYICLVCGDKKSDGTTLLRQETLNGCEGDTIEVYACHCGEIHIRSLGSYDHKWAMVPAVAVGDKRADGSKVKAGDADITYQAPTCYQLGWYMVICEYCGVSGKQPIATVEHENAAGEKFTDSCLDEVTDRHCVVCCEAFDHARFGADHKNCTKTHKVGKKDVYDCLTQYHVHTYCTETCAVDCTDHCNGFNAGCLAFIDDGCQVPSFCHYKLAANRPSTCVQDAHYLEICTDCKEEVMTPAEVNKDIEPAGTVISEGYIYFYGHKPVAAEAIFANYTYLDVKYQEVIVNADGEFELVDEYIPDAQFIEYKAPTFNAEGYAKFYCAECEAVVEQVLPKLSGIGFELDVNNANGSDEYTYGSLVEVIVSINGNDVDINSFSFEVESGFQYVGYETLNNELFNITVTDAKYEATSAIISGVAANTADGKMQNININGKTELVKLFFRVDNAAATKGNFEFEIRTTENEDGETVLVDDVRKWTGAKKTVSVLDEIVMIDKSIDIDLFMDFDRNGIASTSDLSLALMLLTGEHPTGATYDVTVDMNKDGVITLEDLAIGHNLLVGNVKYTEVYLMGISGAELDMYTAEMTKFCVHCGQDGITEDTNYCPNCGRNPHAK